MVGIDEQGPFRNKNGLLSQNVLAACSFDLRFHYVLAGWEGSASDLRVLNSALTRRNKLQVPEGILFLSHLSSLEVYLSTLAKRHNYAAFGGPFFIYIYIYIYMTFTFTFFLLKCLLRISDANLCNHCYFFN
jgi:hypothetical protein